MRRIEFKMERPGLLEVGQERQYVACGDSRGLRGVLDGATESVYRVNCRNLHRSGCFRNLLCICHSTAEEE